MTSKVVTMIARHGVAINNTDSYTLISQDYQTVQVKEDALINAIKGKKISVTNLEVKKGKIECTNGAIGNYNFIDSNNNKIIGVPKAVILDRIETNGRLVGYTMFTQMGTLAEVGVQDAVELANQKLISNGKIRHTQEGDIVSSIGGNYPLREIKITEAPKGEVTTNVMYFATAAGSNSEYVGAIVSGTSASAMTAVIKRLVKSNREIIAAVEKAGAGAKFIKSLKMQRFGNNGIYGVFALSELQNLIYLNNTKLSFAGGNITVSTVKYSKGELESEIVTVLDKKFKVVKSTTEGTSNKALEDIARSYVGKVAKTLNGKI